MADLEQDQAGISLSRTSTATTGRGSNMTLAKVLQVIEIEPPGDPFTSVHARAGGIGSLGGGSDILADIADKLQLEVTGGCSLLASGCGTVSKLHFHSLPVLNIFLAIAFWDTLRSRVSFDYPELHRLAAGWKEYFLFDCFSLERAGIRCFDVAEVQDLASLIHRIGQLPQELRVGIRWFTGRLDGSSFNAFYFPATMLHYVRTGAGCATRNRWLYLGLASEVIPLDPATRVAIRDQLHRPAPMETSQAPVVSLRHIQQQSTSAYTWDLLQRLIDRDLGRVTDYPSWHDVQRLRAAQRAYDTARVDSEMGRWASVEQQLLALSSSLQDGSTFIRRARGLVEASQRAVSAYLLDTDSQQAELEEVAKHSLSHRLDDVVQL